MRKTKIIATLGPATFNKSKIKKLILAGVNVFRINMSHEIKGILLKTIVHVIREESKKNNHSVAILFDLCGPKIRVGKFHEKKSLSITKGKKYSLGHKRCNIPLNIPLKFSSKINTGHIKINDGEFSFEILNCKNNRISVLAENSGSITTGKGINFPGVSLDLPPVTEKDLKDIELAIKLDIDWIAMSFVRSAEDCNMIQDVLESHRSKIPVIAKIEKPEAIKDLNKIIMKFDGILVARGDLGVEMSLHELPILQKKIVNECLKRQKPVIIATQMMESMIKNSKPTRAEVNDIANAIYDGADAVMLSGEPAVGKFPIASVQMMADIANSVERDIDLKNFNRYIGKDATFKNNHRSSICHAAMNLADDLSLDTIVIMTESGKMAMQMAQYRPQARIFALCSQKRVLQFLSLIWGIHSELIDSFIDTDDMFDFSSKLLMERGYLKEGEKYIITAGAPIGVTGSTNMLKIHKAK